MRHNTHVVSGTRASTSNVPAETREVKPRRIDPASPITGQPRFSSQPSMSGLCHDPMRPPERKGKSKRGRAELCCGDWLMPAPWGAPLPVQSSSDK